MALRLTPKLEDQVICFRGFLPLAQRLSWFGHVQRMSETRAAKKIFKWNPLTTRPRGRPKHRWEDNIIQDLGQMEIKNWITCRPGQSKVEGGS